MKHVLLSLLLALTGCATLTPTEKKVAVVVGSVIVVGAIAANQHHADKVEWPTRSFPPCHPQPNGSCR